MTDDAAPCPSCGQLIRLPHRPGARCPICLYEFGSAWSGRGESSGKVVSDLLDVLEGGNEMPEPEVGETNDLSLPGGPDLESRPATTERTATDVEEAPPSNRSWADVVFDSAAELRRCGELALEHRNFQVAIEMLVEATKEDPTSSKGWFNLGLAYTMKDRDEEAKAALTRATALDPESPEVAQLAKILAKRGGY